jgi:hypothetical protein
MNWLTGKGRGKLRVKWKYTTTGQLWRLLPAASGLLVIEERDPERKSVSFTCLDAASGSVRWSGLKLREPWWVTLDLVRDDTVFLHGYSAPDLPDHKSIVAVDLSTGALLWERDDLKLLFANAGSVVAARDGFETREFFELQLRSGETIRSLDLTALEALRSAATYADTPQVVFPEPAVSFGGWKSLPVGLQQAALPSVEPDRTELIEHPHYWIVGHTSAEEESDGKQRYRQLLTIVDRERTKVAFSTVTAGNASAPVPDLFFLFQGLVYFVSGRTTVSAISLGTA